jgi:F-type H+-transporting ATPase subunit delta
MIEQITLARPYARATFNLAVNAGQLPQWQTYLSVLGQIVVDTRVARALTDPCIIPQTVLDMIRAVVADAYPPVRSIAPLADNLLHVLLHYRRIQLLPAIAQLFAKLRADYERRMDVTVISAFALTDQLQAQLTHALASRLGCEVTLQKVVDNALLGGAVIRAGDLVIDGSLRGKLQRLAQELS